MVFVYVLISTEKDSYFEQAFLSISSLKQVSSDAKINLLVDKATYATFVGVRKKIVEMVSNIIIIDIPSTFPQVDKSRFIKTSMYKYVDESFLFIDCDTIICDALTKMNTDCLLGAVLDVHVPISQHSQRKTIYKRNKLCNFAEANQSEFHYNSGVLYVQKAKQCEKFFDLWHKLWLYTREKGISIDQISFNQANALLENMITPLTGDWNCQIMRGGIKYLSNAKIIHYFSSTKFTKGSSTYAIDDSVYDVIKKTGTINEKIEKLIKNPKNAFYDGVSIISSDIPTGLLCTKIFKVLVFLYQNRPPKIKIFSNIKTLRLRNH